ncbi:MAG: BrnT family toxin [Candidatus Omnitrophota bacterium]
MDKLIKCGGFQWDEANFEKNWLKHQVTASESEQIFFNQPLIIADDVTHSKDEERYYALGKTDEQRMLFVVFTIRRNLIRVISARNMSKKERRIYKTLWKKTS